MFGPRDAREIYRLPVDRKLRQPRKCYRFYLLGWDAKMISLMDGFSTK